MGEWALDAGHATRREVLDVYRGRTELDELVSEKLGHLLTKCEQCGLTAARSMLEAEGVKEDDSGDVQRLGALLQVLRLGPERSKQWAAAEADALLALDPEERRTRLEAEPERFGLPHLVDELLERCEAQLTRSPRLALELAELAVEVSLRIDPRVFQDLAFHARARAAAHRGNCLRLNDRRSTAEEAFHHARRLHDKAPAPDPEVEAELCYLEASLAMDQRRFDACEALLERAAGLYRRLEQPRDLALTRIKQANLQYHRGRPAAGLPALEEAAALLDLEGEPELHVTIRFSQALYAVEAGDAELARRHYREHRELLESRPEPWFALRIVWLQAKIARAEGATAAAGELYHRVRAGFLAEGLGYDAALVALELAVLHLEAGDTPAVRRLAAEMEPVFQAQDVHREALAALALFERAARTETLTVALARRLHRFLELARLDPTLRLRELDPRA